MLLFELAPLADLCIFGVYRIRVVADWSVCFCKEEWIWFLKHTNTLTKDFGPRSTERFWMEPLNLVNRTRIHELPFTLWLVQPVYTFTVSLICPVFVNSRKFLSPGCEEDLQKFDDGPLGPWSAIRKAASVLSLHADPFTQSFMPDYRYNCTWFFWWLAWTPQIRIWSLGYSQWHTPSMGTDWCHKTE